ncbi:MAG: GNAT family N-acetyltransferase [Thermoplasmata archaeon]
MKLVTFDELSASMDLDRVMIALSAFNSALLRRHVELWRQRTTTFADYVGVFAVDGGRVVGQIIVLRIPYTFPHGSETITGIASVATRPDYARSGIAGKILADIHRREVEAGIEHAALWTNRSWGAHRLYERFGYRDIYLSPWAVRMPNPPAQPRPITGVRAAQSSDIDSIEQLHGQYARGRLGFQPRLQNSLRLSVETEEISLTNNLLVAHLGRRLAGYAFVDVNPWRVVCGELVGSSRAARLSLVRAVERRAASRPVAFRHTVAKGNEPLLRARGYTVLDTTWYALMGARLRGGVSASRTIDEFGTRDRRFLCMSGDQF